MSSSVVVLDNGAGLLKAGFGGDRDPVAVVPNCLARAPTHHHHHHKHQSSHFAAADQLLSPDLDVTSLPLRRPHDRGYLINHDAQREVWERALRHLLRCDPREHPLLLVEPLFNLPSLQRSADELVFEDLCFPSLCVADPPSLVHLYEASHKSSPVTSHCSLVLDSGFSFTHAAPVVQNLTLNYAVRRVDVGGKALTNYLKELISYRTVNVMEETVIVDDAKENLCFVSMDVRRDLLLARKPGKGNPFRCTYVLPDGVSSKRGFVKDMDEARRFLQLDNGQFPGTVDSEIENSRYQGADNADAQRKIDLTKNEVVLTNERFLVPELLFHPADLGMNEAGLAECIVRAINSCHPHLHPILFESIILTGGNTLFPRFAERLEMELRPLVPDNYRVKITRQKEPVLGVWRGGSLLASSPDFEAMCVTKAEYEENGSARCRRRFFH